MLAENIKAFYFVIVTFVIYFLILFGDYGVLNLTL